jgi:hypothetical protein
VDSLSAPPRTLHRLQPSINIHAKFPCQQGYNIDSLLISYEMKLRAITEIIHNSLQFMDLSVNNVQDFNESNFRHNRTNLFFFMDMQSRPASLFHYEKTNHNRSSLSTLHPFSMLFFLIDRHTPNRGTQVLMVGPSWQGKLYELARNMGGLIWRWNAVHVLHMCLPPVAYLMLLDWITNGTVPSSFVTYTDDNKGKNTLLCIYHLSAQPKSTKCSHQKTN